MQVEQLSLLVDYMKPAESRILLHKILIMVLVLIRVGESNQRLRTHGERDSICVIHKAIL